ncbi:hypothetical protein LIER_22190 [Lithospermum erythrorhizon]|uniref:Homologous recombination OB-fold protein OB-fold domain-containing protein n=1 Tax=Lithospermum erythrorhizon TaxID=34254 RepID=A0AAV3QVG6_LITER
MEPWEISLDVDDSDLPSFLRPCKRLHHQTTTTTSRNERLIPGPAGQLQSAMLQKSHDRQNIDPDNDYVIPTQEYIRKAVQENSSEFDFDFQANAWMSAIQFLGEVDGVIPSTPLSSIKNCLNVGKVDRVVAVINSCTPNGFGGLMVTLKDPTGMVDASIHHRVLSESEFGKNLLIGSVVILQKVAVFAPSRNACYLNITLRNLIKVFAKDRNPCGKQVNAAYRFVAPEIECNEQTSRLDGMSSEHGTIKDIQEEARRFTPLRQVQNDSQREKENVHPRSPSFQKEVSINPSTNAAIEIPAKDKGGFEATAVSSTGAETKRDSRAQNQTQPLLARSSLPLYTDEQLHLLFANDDEDDGFGY